MSAKKTRKQEKLVEGIIAGKTVAQAAREAGYSENKPKMQAKVGIMHSSRSPDRPRCHGQRRVYARATY